MVDEPEHRAEIDASLQDVYETLFMTASPTCTKAALNLLGPRRRRPAPAAGGGDRRRDGGRARDARTPRPAHERPRVSSKLRVLPLGGLGEIGKNMTVVEYDGRIVVVDVGLRFPTPEMVGIDLVLPDFSYLRERARDIEAIVITHGHEDHLGALPWVLRELGEARRAAGIRRRADGRDGALQARRAQAARRRAERGRAGGDARARAVLARARAHDALDPRLQRRGARHRPRHRADHGRLQVRPDARRRAAGGRLAPGGARGARACCCCAGTPRTSTAPASRRRSRSSGRTWRRCSRAARAASW